MTMIPNIPQMDPYPKEDRVTQTKSIYDVSAFEIFWRNLLAGMSRALGGIVLYVIFVIIFSTVFVQYVLPQIMPFLNTFLKLGDSVTNLQNMGLPSNISLPNNFPSFNLQQQ